MTLPTHSSTSTTTNTPYSPSPNIHISCEIKKMFCGIYLLTLRTKNLRDITLWKSVLASMTNKPPKRWAKDAEQNFPGHSWIKLSKFLMCFDAQIWKWQTNSTLVKRLDVIRRTAAPRTEAKLRWSENVSLQSASAQMKTDMTRQPHASSNL